MQFDTRAHVLAMEINSDWDPEVRQQWLENKQGVRTELIHEFGNQAHERKISDFAAMKSAPWSIIDEHNVFLEQIRNCFTQGSYYPALVGACTLGERILNELFIRLRGDFAGHRVTATINTQDTVSDWVKCINALFQWGVIDDPTATVFNDLRKLRNKSVHYSKHLLGADAREDALVAILSLQSCIETLFRPFGGPPRFIANTPGHSFVSLASEKEPLIKRFILPSCVLVSPNFAMKPVKRHGGFAFEVFDDEDYQTEFNSLTDAEFAQHRQEPRRPSLRAPE